MSNDKRSEFEACFSSIVAASVKYSSHFDLDENGEYDDQLIQCAFEGWQAHSGSLPKDMQELLVWIAKFCAATGPMDEFDDYDTVIERIKEFRAQAESLSGAVPMCEEEIIKIDAVIAQTSKGFCTVCAVSEGNPHEMYCIVKVLEEVRASLQKKGR